MTLRRNQSGERSWWKLRSSTVETSTLTGGVSQSLGPPIWKAVLLSRDIAKPVFFLVTLARGRARGGRVNQSNLADDLG